MESIPYTLVVALDSGELSRKTANYAIDLVTRLACPYKLYFIHAIGLNPAQSLPFLDDLDKANNYDIEEKGERVVAENLKWLEQYKNKVQYEWVTLKEAGECGVIIEKYINSLPHVDIVITGTRNYEGVKKFIMGSLSEYLVHHIKYPVVVIKST
ncbi:adenine nucleotide alpha hydrolases-like protein [Basidiobolus meristosporus CBS 931.73]|uniref:Adenine nucleotide alpha hydrolases-like protein n=1 Tax=Basidiobolus meristosporus CBS 931.73 TaxID=1314790 RepID=A0A1Y1Z5U5_9FUNG|nr:adenine nucleotide alpha hydrolases-like protein [Basidiobolus meristosporus CBS 931.73]|eukprot:ORY05633.1 adenine nucleotide alpha hydrolases-like protein [Basidiobolus meristosporus CBS 931.73]